MQILFRLNMVRYMRIPLMAEMTFKEGGRHSSRGNGDDLIYGGYGGDLVKGESNDDTIYDHGSDYIFGNIGNDDIYAGQGADTILGGSGLTLRVVEGPMILMLAMTAVQTRFMFLLTCKLMAGQIMDLLWIY